MSAPRPARCLRFGDFELDLERRILLRAGERVELQDKPFEVLVTLVERPRAIVTRNQLRERLWADQIVEFDNNLNTALTKVRRALGDSANDPRWIETVPKRGYRWIGEIEDVGAPPDSAQEAQDSGAKPTQSARPGRWSPSRQALALAALGLVVVLLPLLGRPGSWSESSPASPPSADAREAARTLLVVLPFVESGLDPEGLADVWTEELITRLAERLPREVGVIARTSAMRYRGQALDLRELATDLGVRFAIEGSLRGNDEGLEIHLRLIEVESQAHRWATRLEGPIQALPRLQETVVADLTDELGLRALAPPPERGQPVPDEAWRAYLRGRHLLQQHGEDRPARVAEAVESFRRALELASEFAPAWSALAEALHRHRAGGAAAQVESRRAALRSLALDPSRAEPYLRMAQISLYQDWDWDEADHYLSEADRLAPNAALVKHVRAAWFSTLGRHEEAQAQLDAALRLDPLSVVLHADTGWYEFVSRRYDAAVTRCDEALALEPGHRGAQWYRLRSLLALGRQNEVERQALDLLVTEGAGEARRETARRQPEQALQLLFELRRGRLQDEVDAGVDSRAALALAHLDLGDHERAMELLIAGADHPGAWIYPFLAVYPPLDTLRDHGALDQLVGRVGIP